MGSQKVGHKLDTEQQDYCLRSSDIWLAEVAERERAHTKNNNKKGNCQRKNSEKFP